MLGAMFQLLRWTNWHSNSSRWPQVLYSYYDRMPDYSIIYSARVVVSKWLCRYVCTIGNSWDARWVWLTVELHSNALLRYLNIDSVEGRSARMKEKPQERKKIKQLSSKSHKAHYTVKSSTFSHPPTHTPFHGCRNHPRTLFIRSYSNWSTYKLYWWYKQSALVVVRSTHV